MVPDVRRAVSMDLKRAGDLVYQVGLTRPELGGSEYARHLGLEGGTVPAPDLKTAPSLFAKLHEAISGGYVQACHDLSEGGLAVAAAEMAFGGGLGLDLDLARVPAEPLPAGYDADATALFSESCSRFLVEVAPEHQGAFEALLDGQPLALLGRVRADAVLELRGTAGGPLTQLPLSDLSAAHKSSFQG
jgi:phosphoribosylformylglycinamidine synthase